MSKKEYSLIWENYRSNYIKEEPEEEDDDDDIFNDGEGFEGDDEHDGSKHPNGLNLYDIPKLFRVNQPIPHYTPWGLFHSNNPLSPTNMYELWMVHFKGFSVFSFGKSGTGSEFINLMNSIDGVAIWSQHDPYCIVIGPAKAYSIEEIRRNVEKALFGKLDPDLLKKEEPPKETNEAKSLLLFNNGVKNIIVEFPNGLVDIIEDPSEEAVDEVNKALIGIAGVTAYLNGQKIEKMETTGEFD